jgi:hypothetical protein
VLFTGLRLSRVCDASKSSRNRPASREKAAAIHRQKEFAESIVNKFFFKTSPSLRHSAPSPLICFGRLARVRLIRAAVAGFES